MGNIKMVLIPPYRNPVVNWAPVLHELVENYRKKGGLDGINIDIDDGYLVDDPSENRDEEVLAIISVGFIIKAKHYSASGKYDAIVSTAGLDPGFVASRVVCKTPIVGAIHSAVHTASLIGERFSIIHVVAPTTLSIKHAVERYGFGHKLASARFVDRWSQNIYGFLQKYSKEERSAVPEGKIITEEIANQCIAAIEQDRADSLLFLCEPIQAFEDEVRQRLDASGYEEIPIICGLPAGIEMARAMVNMKLMQTARAYPNRDLKAKPTHW